MARIPLPKPPKIPKPPKSPKGPAQAPKAPAGKEKFLDRMGRYSLYGQMFGNDSANMTMGQRIGGAAYSAFEQATLGQMGTLGKAMSAGISARGKIDQAGGSGPHDTQDIQFNQIKGDDVVAAINQSTGQMVAGLNTVNHTLGRGFNRLGDDIQAQGQALNSIVAANDKLAIEMRELYEQLNKMSYDRGGGGGASTLPGRTPNEGPDKTAGGSILGKIIGSILSGAGIATAVGATGAGALMKKLFGIGDDVKPPVTPPVTPETKSPATPKQEQPRQPKGAVDSDGKKIGGQYKAPPATPGSGGNWYDDAMKAFAGAGKSVLKLGAKAAGPVLAAIAIWDAWQEINALDPKMPLDKYRAEVARIIGKAVGDFGLGIVGAVIGGFIAGTVSGPGAILGMIGGAIAAELLFGDNIDALVDSVVNFLYEGKDEPVKKPAEENKKVSATTPQVTRVSSSDATQIPSESSIPEDANPIRNSKGEIIGYQPAGGGPTVALKGREEELRSLRSSAVNNYTDDAIRLLQKKRNKEQIAKDLGISSEDADTAAPDAAPVKAAPPVGEQPDNWDEEFYSKFPEWMNVKDLDYPASRLMDTPDTSEQKLKEQEALAEEAQKKTIGENLLINAKELTFKADKIVFDTSSLEFNYDAKATPVKSTGTDNAPAPAAPSPTTRAGAPPSARLPGGAAPGSTAEAARAPSGVTGGGGGGLPGAPGGAPGVIVNGGSAPIPQAPDPALPQQYQKPSGTEGTGQDLGEIAGSSQGVLPAAVKMLGMNETKDYHALNTFMNQYSGTAPLPINTDAGPWCAKFVNGVLGSQGIPGTGANNARSFMNYGATVYDKATGQGDPKQAQPGDIVVFPRTSDPSKGHVAFVESVSGDSINFIGGNQGGRSHGGGGVTRDSDKISNVLTIRRPGAAGQVVPNAMANVPSAGGGGGGMAPAPAASPVASSGGGGGMPAAIGAPTNVGGGMGGGGDNPLAAMLGGGGSPFGMASNLLGPVIGSMSKNTSLNAAAPPANPATTNINVGSNQTQGGGGAGKIDPGSPQPAISSMFARLFEGSALFG